MGVKLKKSEKVTDRVTKVVSMKHTYIKAASLQTLQNTLLAANTPPKLKSKITDELERRCKLAKSNSKKQQRRSGTKSVQTYSNKRGSTIRVSTTAGV